MRFLLLSVLLLAQQAVFAFSCEDAKPIIQKPIIYDQTRINLTKDYQYRHYRVPYTVKIDPKMIVLHYSMYPTLASTYKAFYSSKLSHAVRPDLPGNLNVSSHFLVDRDGTIYQLMPDNWMARHVVGMNHYAIGVENVGGVDDKPDLTEKQLEANAFLVCHLKKKYPAIKYLIGHREYLSFKGSKLWLERHGYSHPLHKEDPGKAFMQRVSMLTSHLKLTHVPPK